MVSLRCHPIALAVLLVGVVHAAKPTSYYADLGPYGLFELEISADGGTMTWASTLENMKELETALGVTIPSLNYHLHQQWTTADSDFGIGGDECGASVTGGHYDPFLGCGPASGVSDEVCLANGKARTADRYNCSPEVFSGGAHFECEVGDLSGKDGPIAISADGTAVKRREAADPLAAIHAQFVDERVAATPDKFGSIVFHNGSPRVLCGKLVEGVAPGGSPTSSSRPLQVFTAGTLAALVLLQLVL